MSSTSRDLVVLADHAADASLPWDEVLIKVGR